MLRAMGDLWVWYALSSCHPFPGEAGWNPPLPHKPPHPSWTHVASGQTPAQGQSHNRCLLGTGPVPTKVGRRQKEPAWAWRLGLRWGAAADGAWRGAEEAQGNVASRGNVPCSRCPQEGWLGAEPGWLATTSVAQLPQRSWGSTWLSGVH